MKVFITGGTGFIGARLAEKLIEKDHELVMLARNPSMISFAGNKKVSVIKGDLSDREALRKGMESCDWVFHMAAYAKPSFKDPSDVTSVNIDGTVNVLEAALRAGVTKVVFTSTGGTMSYSRDGKPVDEETNKNPKLHTLYEKTKAEGEKIAADYLSKGLEVVIVNPTRVYGPGRLSESNSVTRIIKLYISGKWRIIPGDGRSAGNYVYVDDVAEGHILAAMKGRGGERYILGGENHSFNSLFDTIGEAAGKKRILLKLPAGLMKAIAGMLTFFSRVLGVSVPITGDFVEKYLRDWIITSGKAERELGYKITSLSRGVALTIDWLKKTDDGKKDSSYAVVTGASTGIGRAIALELASRKHNLVLSARHGKGLPELCRKLESDHGINVHYFLCDLTELNGPESLFEFVRERELKIDILVNNAGIGYEGPVEGYSQKQIDNMLMLNVRAVTMLTMLFMPGLKAHERSYILNMSSFGCYFPTAYKSIYLASKSYIFYFTRAIASELKGSGVKACVAVPSAVRTNINTRDRIERNGWFSQKSALEPEEVASKVIKGMFRGRNVILPGKLSALFFGLGLFIPEGILMWITRRIFRNYRQGWIEA